MSFVKRAWVTLRCIVTDAPILCEWCHGSRIFDPRLPMACPRCNGSGKVHCRSGRRWCPDVVEPLPMPIVGNGHQDCEN